MFFALSKIIFTLIAPSNLCLFLLGGGLLLSLWKRWQRLGRRLTVAGFTLLLMFGLSPFGKWISKPLEDRFSAAVLPDVPAITDIVLLGGFELAALGRSRERIATNAAAERLLAIVPLARRYPAARIVFTGGYGNLLGTPVNAGAWIKGYLADAGINPRRIVLEGQSRTTWENALFVKDVLAAQKTACPCGYLLVTSAWHMPRSVGIFRKVGFDDGGRRLYPWPVDYRTQGGADLWRPFGWLHSGLRQTDLATKEWIGLLAYWLKGRTSELWPGPIKKSS